MSYVACSQWVTLPLNQSASMRSPLAKLAQTARQITGINNNASAPSGMKRRQPTGRRNQAKAATMVRSGRSSKDRKIPMSSRSTSGASHRPARKPRMTVGSAAITSIDGLTIARSGGDMKYAV